jgi:hypothetical protein
MYELKSLIAFLCCFLSMNYPEAEPSRYQAEKLIFSFMKTIRFQTFLFDPEVEPRGIL